MTEPASQPDLTPDRFPVSCPQELWCGQAGAFGPRFIMAEALRISGRIDVACLQGALNDLVVRHEILRTVVVPDAVPPYQRVHPPLPVPLKVRDLPVTDLSRDRVAKELLTEAERSTLNVNELPLLRALLTRFDDTDSVLALVTHHTAGDGWSTQLIKRDLAAFYAARASGHPARLPDLRQYRDYAAWQQERVVGPQAAAVQDYWRKQLSGARIFALPTDRPIPEVHQSPYAAYNHPLDAELMAKTNELATATRNSAFTVLLATFNVLAHKITGTTDPVINTLTAGREQREFHNTVGPFLNFLALRTDLGTCTSFREVLASTRKTCLQAYSHEVPIQLIERDIPELMQPLQDRRMCDFIFGFFRPMFNSGELQLADGSSAIRQREEVSPDIPGGASWTVAPRLTGDAMVKVLFNPDEFDERTIAGWVTEYQHVLACVTADPDREWKTV
jgi:hypothetical protein